MCACSGWGGGLDGFLGGGVSASWSLGVDGRQRKFIGFVCRQHGWVDMWIAAMSFGIFLIVSVGFHC